MSDHACVDRRISNRLGQWLSWHVWIALHITLAYGLTAGMLYWCMPPLFLLIAVVLVPVYPAFGWPVLLVTCVLLALLVAVIPVWRRHWPTLWSRRLVVAIALWLPLIAGESVRMVAMYRQISVATPVAYSTRPLWLSIRAMSGTEETHAWMLTQDGLCHRWSYKQMRF